MKKNVIRKSFSILFCLIFCLSCTMTAFADEVKVKDMVVDGYSEPETADNDSQAAPVPTDGSATYNLEKGSDRSLSPIEAENSIRMDESILDTYATDSINLTNNTKPAAPMSANTPPVAGLNYLIANPESLVNGNITTDTIIYWLWEDEEQKYTYDPDGDAIDQILTDGINEFIVGNITLNDVVVGFATQITVAGEYLFLYQAVDEHGAASNILQYDIQVEPADGNQRPICITTASTSTPATEQNVAIDFSASYDPDQDNLTNVKVKVYDSVGNYQYVTASSPYYVGMTDSSILLKFAEAGIYSVWTSMSDDKNAWSNWSVIELNVTEKVTYTFRDVKLSSTDPSNKYPTLLTWANYGLSLDYRDKTDDPVWLYEYVTQNTIPAPFKGRTILSMDWEIYGYIMSNTDTPLANATVIIKIPLFGGNQDFEATIRTNKDGRFYYQCTPETWYSGWNGDYSPSGGMSGEVTQWCRYGNLSNTEWMGASTLYVTCSSVTDNVSYPVVATTGDILEKILAHRWVYIKPTETHPYPWIDLDELN